MRFILFLAIIGSILTFQIKTAFGFHQTMTDTQQPGVARLVFGGNPQDRTAHGPVWLIIYNPRHFQHRANHTPVHCLAIYTVTHHVIDYQQNQTHFFNEMVGRTFCDIAPSQIATHRYLHRHNDITAAQLHNFECFDANRIRCEQISALLDMERERHIENAHQRYNQTQEIMAPLQQASTTAVQTSPESTP